MSLSSPSPFAKGGEIRDTKTLNLSRNIVSLQVLVDVSRFSPCVINLLRNKNICCRLKKVLAKSRARVYFVQQILALLLVFHQTHNLARNNFARALAYQPIRALHFFDQQQIKLIMQGEKRDTSTKTCNETMLRNKLSVFVSRISTLIRFQTKTELFCSGYGYRPHYNAENDHRKRSHSKRSPEWSDLKTILFSVF